MQRERSHGALVFAEPLSLRTASPSCAIQVSVPDLPAANRKHKPSRHPNSASFPLQKGSTSCDACEPNTWETKACLCWRVGERGGEAEEREEEGSRSVDPLGVITDARAFTLV